MADEGKQIEAVETTDSVAALKNAKIFQKNEKVVHKIYSKMVTFVKTTSENLDHDNFTIILTKVMRDLNKTGIYGFEKKAIAIGVMTLLLESLGVPHTLSYYTAEIIEAQIEHIYSHGLHRWKRPHKHRPKCTIM